MAFVTKLVCSRCGTEYDPSTNPLMCENHDMGRLDIFYDFERIREKLSKAEIQRRPHDGVWRYVELMPAEKEYAARLREGGTPLLHAKRLGEALGLRHLYLKDETRNPTASFKDRAMAIGVTKAVELRKNDVVTASSGNAAASLAAYSASLGLRCYAFVPEDIAAGKASQLLLFGARLIRVRRSGEGKDPTVEMMLKGVWELGWYPCPSFGPFNPYQVEGLKTIAYEVIEQLGWAVPDFMLIPTGSGCLLTGVWKGLQDFQKLEIIDSYPHLIPVQPEGNQPLVRAINAGKRFEEVEAERWPRSIASGLLDPFPWDGDAAIEGTRKTGGFGMAVPDDDILEAVKMLAAMEGVFSEPSGAVGVAALVRLLKDGKVDKSDKVVVLITGSGLKEAEKIGCLYKEPPVISPNVDELKNILSIEF